MGSAASTMADVRRRFQEAGFEFVENTGGPGSIEVGKCNFTLVLKRDADGNWNPDGPPLFLIRGFKCELEDRGYQKFWYAGGKRFPIRLADLRALHRFDQEVRGLLGLKSLYHESLGSTSARSVYDRLAGRPDR